MPVKVSAKINLPAEITKDSVIKQLLEEKQKLEGKIGRLEQKINKLNQTILEFDEEKNSIGKFLDEVRSASEHYLSMYPDYD